jgi:hypothetical protein
MRNVVLGAGMALLVGTLGLYAASDDSYYGDGTSHWEHATKDGGTWFLVGLFAIASAISVGVVLLGLRRDRGRLGLLLIPALAVYVLSLFLAYAVLSLGH